MIEKMILETKKYLPLKIVNASWNGIWLNMYGSDWAFFTYGGWRVVNNNKMLFGCYDKIAKNIASFLDDCEIIEICSQERKLKIDPIFFLSNGNVIEIFSSDIFESWKLNFNYKSYYIATPSEPNLFDPD